ncbi:MAG: acyl-protein synthetase [Clostridia bacterium]|nr:acyl-protein synthetase [Clostridia bacterium]
MSCRSRLFRWPDPYDTASTDALFTDAARECAAYHAAHCPAYRAILDAARFSPGDLTSIGDLARIPAIPTAFLKTHRLQTMPANRLVTPIRATSSGTGGRASEIGLDWGACFCGLSMIAKVAAPRSLLSPRPCHYVVFGYMPRRENTMAAAKTAYGYTFLAPALDRTFALRWENGRYVPDLDGVIRAIVKNAASPHPTRFIGFPAYTYFTLKRMDERGIRVRLPQGSKIMLGGGWKQFWREAVDKTVLYALAERVLGIPEEEIAESYGAAEHPILYCDCPRHRFHIPVYSRVLIRDVKTLEPLPMGVPGLVNLISPLIRATPLLSILTDDLGILHPGEDCGCGILSPTLELLGRAGMNEIKTCAAGAEEILRIANQE